MKVVTDLARIDQVLSRGVEDVFVKENLKRKLLSGKQLRVKLGIDPTGPKIHLGRAVILRKLRQFQDLGHKVILIVGDFTAMIGDPSDKIEKRPMLTAKNVRNNMKSYKKQLGKIIDLKNAEFKYNSQWLKKLNALEISSLAESFSVLQMSNRRNFKERLDKGEEVSLREFLYPIFQGYDSVAVKADVEIGGFDQLFNLKAGRVVQRHYKMSEQDVLTGEMLEGTDGRKMSTTWSNIITIVDSPADMFGKVMTVRDDLIPKYFKLCTDLSPEKIPQTSNPRDAKMRLAYEIVKIYHGGKKAQEAQENFVKIFQKKEIPENVEIVTRGGSFIDIFLRTKISESKSEAVRLLKAGAVTDLTDGRKISEKDSVISGHVYKIGKHRFIKIK